MEEEDERSLQWESQAEDDSQDENPEEPDQEQDAEDQDEEDQDAEEEEEEAENSDSDSEKKPKSPQKKLLPQRLTRGRKMKQLLGEAAENDAKFWGHDIWNEDDHDSEYEAEPEHLYRDIVDSDFDEDVDEVEDSNETLEEREKELAKGEKKKKKPLDSEKIVANQLHMKKKKLSLQNYSFALASHPWKVNFLEKRWKDARQKGREQDERDKKRQEDLAKGIKPADFDAYVREQTMLEERRRQGLYLTPRGCLSETEIFDLLKKIGDGKIVKRSQSKNNTRQVKLADQPTQDQVLLHAIETEYFNLVFANNKAHTNADTLRDKLHPHKKQNFTGFTNIWNSCLTDRIWLYLEEGDEEEKGEKGEEKKGEERKGEEKRGEIGENGETEGRRKNRDDEVYDWEVLNFTANVLPDLFTKPSPPIDTNYPFPATNANGNGKETETHRKRKICCISGKPANYQDPLTKEFYHSKTEFKILRQNYALTLSREQSQF